MKEEQLHNTSFEQQLKQAADRLEMQPSEELWQRIRQELPEARKPILWWRWAAAAAVLLLAGIGSWYLLSDHESGKAGLVSNPPAVHQPATTGAPSRTVQKPGHLSDTMRAVTPSSLAASEPAPPSSRASASAPQPLDEAQADAGLRPLSQRQQQPQIKKSTPLWTSDDHAASGQREGILPVLRGTTALTLRSATTDEAPGLQYSEEMTRLLLEQAGQEELLAQREGAEKEGTKLSVGLFFTPGISYRTLKTGSTPSPQMSSAPVQGFANGQPVSQEVVMRVNAREKPMQQKRGWGWGTGLRLALNLPEDWILKTGIALRQTNYDVTAYEQRPAYVTSNGAVADGATSVANSSYARYAAGYTRPQEPTTLKNRYLSTELPILVGKSFGNTEAFSFTVLAGAGLTYLLQSNSVMYAPASQRYFYDKSYLSPFNSSLILEASIHIPLGTNLGFSIGPALQYQMFSSYKDYSAVKEYPYLIGLKTAFSLR